MATHSSILAWKIPQIEQIGGLCMVHGFYKESDTTERLSTHSFCLFVFVFAGL